MRRAQSINPLLLSLLGWVLTLSSFELGEVLIATFGWSRMIGLPLASLVIATLSVPAVSFVFLCTHYKSSIGSISKIVQLYAALILIFSNVNFDLMLHFGHGHILPFSGIAPMWTTEIPGRPEAPVWHNIILGVASCLHFSVATLSTFNDGQIIPQYWWVKLVVDVQVLMGLGLTILTVGCHFAQRAETASKITDTQYPSSTSILESQGRQLQDSLSRMATSRFVGGRR